jgi:nicotinic acid phosphoribosyltransferase
MRFNPVNAIDAYKLDHRRQYPPGTTRVYSNFTPRGSRVAGVTKVVFFGLQAFLKNFCEDQFGEWFSMDEETAVQEYVEFTTRVLGPNDIGGEHIRALHRLGYLPLRFCALPEGTLCPLRVPMFTVENTHPDFFWLVNYIESILSAQIWLPSTSATQAWRLRQLLDERAQETGGSLDFVPFQGHDFSFRGMTSIESSAASGAGHLLSFTGTDSLPALEFVDAFYPGDNGFVGGSVAATEHSVMCAGSDVSELKTFERLLDLYPTGIVSVVSDTWDLWNVLTNILPQLKDKIMARDGKLVIRPDSGDPVDIICGERRTSSTFSAVNRTPAEKGVAELLWEVFGGTINRLSHRDDLRGFHHLRSC